MNDEPRKAGQPKKADADKKKQRRFSATDSEYAEIQERARKSGMSVSAYVLTWVLGR